VMGALRVFHLRRKNNHSFVVNILAQALYELFAANDGKCTHVRLRFLVLRDQGTICGHSWTTCVLMYTTF
jgi:hypothetical protein